ncbi:MAG: sugar transferase [Candidatus Acetothermia bacterium]|jgi:lipopolysaccharide/colanic/teichoic acid biosynthesis glycosyltransferase|nr:sugar transferase [Candidatus Acetothermia bacterium]MDH7505853.1 sugar transferase [Candidatus Acetothermia bacterium]
MRGRLFLKRALDFAASLIGLILLAVPFALIALAIKLDSKGPVFFRQERVGRQGRIFRPWKFRTMVEGAVEQGLGYNVAEDDPRITRVGRFLREWGLDELPQLINVLRGEMSLVGPRPTLKYQVERYNEFQRRRLSVKPGITGWALIHGRNLLSWEERIKYDVWYAEHWSLPLDLWILLKTVWVVLIKREGVYGPGGINEDFTGTLPKMGDTKQDG